MELCLPPPRSLPARSLLQQGDGSGGQVGAPWPAPGGTRLGRARPGVGAGGGVSGGGGACACQAPNASDPQRGPGGHRRVAKPPGPAPPPAGSGAGPVGPGRGPAGGGSETGPPLRPPRPQAEARLGDRARAIIYAPPPMLYGFLNSAPATINVVNAEIISIFWRQAVIYSSHFSGGGSHAVKSSALPIKC